MDMNTPEFWNGIIGDLILFLPLWILVLCYAISFKEESHWRWAIAVGFVIMLSVYGEIHYAWPAREKGRQEGLKETSGMPIVSKIEGHVFTPLAFVITEHRILVYDKDEKVYALDSIKLDKSLTPETLTVGTNISYTVFNKAGQLYLSRM